MDNLCDAPNATPNVKRGCHFFFHVYYKLINFKLVHSYNVQNIYKLHIWKCSTFTIFTLLTKETKNTYTLDQMVFQWVPSDVLTLTADADCLIL